MAGSGDGRDAYTAGASRQASGALGSNHGSTGGNVAGADYLADPSSKPDLDVTVLAFAQWVSEMKSRQQNSHRQMQGEMSMIRNAITSNQTELSDFKRHGATIQTHMQSEMNEIRESLSTVFMEITAAVRNNTAADQDIKLKIQSLNEQAVRNETQFAQLADAADQSQSKLRNAVQELQFSSERMRSEVGTLRQQTDGLQTGVGERAERTSGALHQVQDDLRAQLERRRDHLRKMVNDVTLIGESLKGLVSDFGATRRGSEDLQGKLQSTVYAMDQQNRRDVVMGGSPSQTVPSPYRGCVGGLAATADALQPQGSPNQATSFRIPQSMPQGVPHVLPPSVPQGIPQGLRPYGLPGAPSQAQVTGPLLYSAVTGRPG